MDTATLGMWFGAVAGFLAGAAIATGVYAGIEVRRQRAVREYITALQAEHKADHQDRRADTPERPAGQARP